jgi:hypothetical protein
MKKFNRETVIAKSIEILGLLAILALVAAWVLWHPLD